MNSTTDVFDFRIGHFDGIEIDIPLINMVRTNDNRWISSGQRISQPAGIETSLTGTERDSHARKRTPVGVCIDTQSNLLQVL